MRPLVTTPNDDYVPAPDRKPGASMKHVFGIIAIAVVAFAVLGYLMWRASDRKEAGSGTVIEDSTSPVTTQTQDETSETSEPSDTAASTPPTSTTAATPPVAGNALTATPPAQDYGTVGKGTRAVRRFTLTNTSGQAIKLKVSRSACHCLYYTHKPSIAPNGRETLTITVDGAKARVGALHETVEITSADGSVRTSVDVNATIR